MLLRQPCPNSRVISIGVSPAEGDLERFVQLFKAKVADDGKVAITGYPKFFNNETTQCNDVTFSRNKPQDDPDVASKVTQDIRTRNICLTMAMNAAISGAVTAKNYSCVIFIDVDLDFERPLLLRVLND
ncbi:multidrug resistance protein fer6 [Physcia stellaris]|nr:multidrug resistance protein fer6 [Physcia stellaris]